MAKTNGVDRIWEAIEDIRLCMLTSQDGGMLRSRPMAATPDRDAHCIWFLTDVRDHKDEEISAQPQVCAAFADIRNNTWVSISGRAEVRRDRIKAKELWGPESQAWFPGGPDDPNLALLRLEPTKAEIWDATSSSIVYALETARAALTGSRPSLGDNEKVAM
jgi:general stress protein 26